VKRTVFAFMILAGWSTLLPGWTVNSFALNNGVQVLLIPDATVQSVTITSYFLTGARDDPDDARGAASLFQILMMYSPIENLNNETHLSFVNSVGGLLARPRVGYDYSVFSQTVPASEIEYALLLDSERLKSLRLTADMIERAKEFEFRTRSAYLASTTSNNRAALWVMAQLLAGTPYENPLSGDLDKLRSLDTEHVREAYNRFRDPAAIVLAIAGNFDAADVKTKISKFFLPLAGGGSKKTPLVPRKFDISRGYIYKNWTDVGANENFVIYGFRAPPLTSPDYLYFDCLRFYLTDPRVSYFDNGLNRVNHLNVSIYSQLTDYFDANACFIYFGAPSRVALEKTKYFINVEMQALETNLIGLGRLKTVKNLMELDYLKALGTPEGKTLAAALYAHAFGDPNYSTTYLQRLRRTTSYDVMRIIKKYLARENRVVLNACK
jgi:zinc protease